MRISQLEITEFRGVKAGRVVFPAHCVLLGANNVGKSTIAEGLAVLSGREGLTRPLCDWDFHGGTPKGSSRFLLVATLTDFGDPSRADPGNYPEWFAGEAAAVPVWWDEKQEQVRCQADPPAGTRQASHG